MSTLRRALEIAIEAHDGQVDKRGAPYIFHPMRVMLSMTNRDEQIVAALHDVVEDNEAWTLGRLKDEGFSKEVLRAVDALTKRPTEAYFDYIHRVQKVKLAIQVKLGDLEDNLDSTRLRQPLSASDLERMERYQKARTLLSDSVEI